MRNLAREVGLLVLAAALGGCAYATALRQLPPEEQTLFRIYSKVMTPEQARAYLRQPTAAARAAYLEATGLAQRFQALDAADREAVLAGQPRPGMSADALRFLWGEPYHTEGWTGHYEHWYYLGSTWDLLAYGSRRGFFETMVFVYLVDGRVKWWLETPPTGVDVSEDGGRRT
ncbi:MAG: hypothetical protein KatS3mg131_0516 [Candidatus Tectimicrobiota bacterium]|nr:MAG: hypothetical protein KatS3mg131_0516 [Candidatus Tectomicrobia bacterium]